MQPLTQSALALKGESVVPVEHAIETLHAWPHGHVAVVVGMMRKLGLDRVLAVRPSREKSMALALVAGRVIHPGSKLSLSRHCLPEARLSTLGQVLDVEGARRRTSSTRPWTGCLSVRPRSRRRWPRSICRAGVPGAL